MTVMTTGTPAIAAAGVAAAAPASASTDSGACFAQVLSDTTAASGAPVPAPGDAVEVTDTPVAVVTPTTPDAISTLTPEVSGPGPKVHVRTSPLPMKGQVSDHVSPDDAVAVSVILSLQPSTVPLVREDPPTDLPSLRVPSLRMPSLRLLRLRVLSKRVFR